MSVASTYLRCRSSSDTPIVAIMAYTHAAVKLRRYASRPCAGFGDGALWAPVAIASHAGWSAASHPRVSPIWVTMPKHGYRWLHCETVGQQHALDSNGSLNSRMHPTAGLVVRTRKKHTMTG